MNKNRRIYREPTSGERAWRLASSIAVFIVALAVAALLSIDDVEGTRPQENEQP